MPSLGMGELVVILLIVLLVFGSTRLPQLAESIGKSVRSLKRGLNTDEEIEIKQPPKSTESGRITEGGSSATERAADAEIVEKR